MMNGQYPSPANDEQRATTSRANDVTDNGLPPDEALDALLAADVAAWRTTLPEEERFSARMVGLLRSVELPASTPLGTVAAADAQDEVQFVREPLDESRGERGAWRLPARARRRGRGVPAVGAMAAVVAVLIVLIELAAPHGSTISTVPAQTITAKPPITLPSGGWQQIALPVRSAQGADYAISPSDPATIYACFGGGVFAAPGGQTIAGANSVWVTHDTGRHWRAIGPSLGGGSACQVSIARGAPGRIGVLVGGTGDVCQAGGESIYLSDDGGARWRSIPYQEIATGSATVPSCELTVTGDAVYMYSSWLTGEPVSGGVQLSAWQRTTDDGRTWQRLDPALGAQTLFMPWEVGTGDSFITNVLPAPGNLGGALWITHDGGARWQRLGPLPLGVGTFVLPAPAPGLSDATAARPFYALRGEQVPPETFILTAEASTDGRTWAKLPPLPVPGANDQRSGMTNVLGVDAAGRLYTFGVDPARGVPSQSTYEELERSPQWLWIWDPSAARWERFPTPLGASWPPLCGALCWHGVITTGPAGASYLWVDVLGGDSDVTPALYRVQVR